MKKILLAYFSATGNTKKIAQKIEVTLSSMNIDFDSVDITSYSDRKHVSTLKDYDSYIFGFPIYSMRAPRICREWLQSFNGQGKKCSVFFTYGGFGKDPAHYYIQKLLNEQNFELVSTAEFLGAHTFNLSGWRAAMNRPNDDDFTLASDFVKHTVEKFIADQVNALKVFDKPVYSSTQLDQAEKMRFQLITQLPTRGSKLCSMCKLCENQCPTKAMDALRGIATEKCIACFKCIENCPDKVLFTNDLSYAWQKKLAYHSMTEEKIESLESKLYL